MKYLIADNAGKHFPVIFSDGILHKDVTANSPVKFIRAGHLVMTTKSQTLDDGRVVTGMNFICIPEVKDVDLPGDREKDEELIKSMIGENI